MATLLVRRRQPRDASTAIAATPVGDGRERAAPAWPRHWRSTLRQALRAVRRMPSFFAHRRRDAGGRLQRALRGLHHRRSPAARGAAARLGPGRASGACTSNAPTSAADVSSGTRIPTRSTRTCAGTLGRPFRRAAYRISRTSLGAGVDARLIVGGLCGRRLLRHARRVRGARPRAHARG